MADNIDVGEVDSTNVPPPFPQLPEIDPQQVDLRGDPPNRVDAGIVDRKSVKRLVIHDERAERH
jgi:hypothetical protein